jgi:hypothetical protein
VGHCESLWGFPASNLTVRPALRPRRSRTRKWRGVSSGWPVSPRGQTPNPEPRSSGPGAHEPVEGERVSSGLACHSVPPASPPNPEPRR